MFAHPLSASVHNFSHGTAVFVTRTPNEIVVAADSRSVKLDGSPDSDPVCKIRRFSNAYVVVNGMSQDSSTGYDVLSLLKEAGEQKGLLADKIATFERLVQSPLEKALTRLKRDEPLVFQRNVIEIGPLGVNFFGSEQGVLVFYHRRFVVSPSPNNDVSVYIERLGCPGVDCPDGVAYILVGADEFKKRFEREKLNFMQGDLVKAARQFVQMHIDAQVVDVGPPIDILRIKKNGTQWIERKPECEDK
jgi:hypothetical protein